MHKSLEHCFFYTGNFL